MDQHVSENHKNADERTGGKQNVRGVAEVLVCWVELDA